MLAYIFGKGGNSRANPLDIVIIKGNGHDCWEDNYEFGPNNWTEMDPTPFPLAFAIHGGNNCTKWAFVEL
jgi:hypothetical protein